MGKVISIGKQDFASLRENDYFFVDKTKFIKKGGKMEMILHLLHVRGVLEKH